MGASVVRLCQIRELVQVLWGVWKAAMDASAARLCQIQELVQVLWDAKCV